MANTPATSTDIQIATDSVFSDVVVNDSGAYRTTRSFVKGDLPYGVTLFARVRHGNDTAGNSDWSAALEFKIIVPANVIGICLDNSGTKGTFYWIDALGNKLSSFDYTTHPVFKNISMVTVDDARAPVTMTKIPLFYIKTAVSGPVGTFADGKKCWWISDLKDLGYRPAAAFKRSTRKDSAGKYVISAACFMGTYLSHTETVAGANSLGSKKGQTPVTGQSRSTCKAYITNRNNDIAGINGFRMFDIWDLGLLRLLLTTAKCNSDSQTSWGDNANSVVDVKTGATNARAVFKGTQTDPQVFIDDLWRCYWYYTDLISINSGIVSLASPIDLTNAVTFGTSEISRYTMPTTSGWVKDILDCPMTLGDDSHDLMELFLPKTVVSAESQATFSDKFSMNDAAGEIYAGGAAAFTETYQSYEQTSSTSVSYWSQYGSGCPNRTYYSTPGQTYKDKYGGFAGCPLMITAGVTGKGTVISGDTGQHKPGCPATNTYAQYLADHAQLCSGSGSMTQRTWSTTCASCNNPITVVVLSASCYHAGYCNTQYSAATSGYKCNLSGGECATSGCGYAYSSTPIYGYVTRTRSTNFTTEPGIFCMSEGLQYLSQNTSTYSCRLCKN